MKKTLGFLRSMRFGLLLLLPVLVCAVLGSVIPQGESESVYAASFPGTSRLILGLGLDHIFRTPVFLILSALFGVNLTLCCFSQLQAVPMRKKAVYERALRSGDGRPLTAEERETLVHYLRRRLWRQTGDEESPVFVTPAPGWYGSVIAHFALLGILLGAAGVFGLSRSADCVLLPGNNTLPDGTVIRLEEFRLRDENDRLDYASTLEITLPSGRSSGLRELRVNHPVRFGGAKYYQQSYGTAGSLSVTVKETGETYPVIMKEAGMISVGGTDGVWYMTVYPGYVTDADGNITPLAQTGGEYRDPLYYVLRVQDGVMTPAMAVPGDEVEVSDAVYRFEPPVTYPAVRVKTTAGWIYGLLYASFLLLTVGLYLCFFQSPAALALRDGKVFLAGKRSDTEWEQRLSFALRG